jgi:CBS-domain-containing membrane protein
MTTAGRGSTIADVLHTMGHRTPPTIPEDATMPEIIHAFCRARHSRLLYVVDRTSILLGVISLGSLIRHEYPALHEPQVHTRRLLGSLQCETAGQIMQRKVVSARPTDSVDKVLKRMIQKNVKELPVIDSRHRVLADLTVVDLLEHRSQPPFA